MAAGPSLDVYTTETETEEWFRRLFCAAAREVDEEVGGGGSAELMQCQVGVLVSVSGGEDGDPEEESSSSTKGQGSSAEKADWAVTELLLYGRVQRMEVPMTPPRSSPTTGPETGHGEVGGDAAQEEESEAEGRVLQANVQGYRSEPKPSPAQAPADEKTTTSTIITVTVHALPLTSHHSFAAALSALRPSSLKATPSSNDTTLVASGQPTVPLTPTNQSKLNHLLGQKVAFLLPNPLDSLQISKSVKKRRADILSQAAENRKKNRLLPSAAPPPALRRKQPTSASLHSTSREPSVARSFLREGTAFSVRAWGGERERELLGADGENYCSRSPSPEKPSLLRPSRPGTSSAMSRPGTSGMPMIKREPSSFSILSKPKLAPPSQPDPLPVSSQPLHHSVSCAVGTDLVKHEPRGGSIAAPLAVGSPTSPPDIQILEETVEARNKDQLSRLVLSGMKLYGLRRGSSSASEIEEYKFVYHHTLKSATFALRGQIAKEVLDVRTAGSVVERLLGLFCGGESGNGSGRSPLVEALVEIETLKRRLSELERQRIGNGVKMEGVERVEKVVMKPEGRMRQRGGVVETRGKS